MNKTKKKSPRFSKLGTKIRRAHGILSREREGSTERLNKTYIEIKRVGDLIYRSGGANGVRGGEGVGSNGGSIDLGRGCLDYRGGDLSATGWSNMRYTK